MRPSTLWRLKLLTAKLGKSALLLVILVFRLCAKLPTIWLRNGLESYIFTEEGIFEYTASGRKIALRAEKTASYLAWVLTDTKTPPPDGDVLDMELFILQAASPREEHIHWGQKRSTLEWYTRPWSLSELFIA